METDGEAPGQSVPGPEPAGQDKVLQQDYLSGFFKVGLIPAALSAHPPSHP